MSREYYVYIMSNRRKTALYIGVTRNLVHRVWQHRNRLGGAFTARYQCTRLVMYEVFGDPYNAIVREKQLKAGSRSKKSSSLSE